MKDVVMIQGLDLRDLGIGDVFFHLGGGELVGVDLDFGLGVEYVIGLRIFFGLTHVKASFVSWLVLLCIFYIVIEEIIRRQIFLMWGVIGFEFVVSDSGEFPDI